VRSEYLDRAILVISVIIVGVYSRTHSQISTHSEDMTSQVDERDPNPSFLAISNRSLFNF